MAKYIYNSKELRCRIKYDKCVKNFELQLQKKIWFLWINTYKWMTVAVGFWGEGGPIKVLRDSYQYGNVSEVYATGKLDINKRVDQFFLEYNEYLEKEKKQLSIFESL